MGGSGQARCVIFNANTLASLSPFLQESSRFAEATLPRSAYSIEVLAPLLRAIVSKVYIHLIHEFDPGYCADEPSEFTLV